MYPKITFPQPGQDPRPLIKSLLTQVAGRDMATTYVYRLELMRSDPACTFKPHRATQDMIHFAALAQRKGQTAQIQLAAAQALQADYLAPPMTEGCAMTFTHRRRSYQIMLTKAGYQVYAVNQVPYAFLVDTPADAHLAAITLIDTQLEEVPA